jgi:ligand-binding sensor domain-containing protein/signal transduction histidine kinase
MKAGRSFVFGVAALAGLTAVAPAAALDPQRAISQYVLTRWSTGEAGHGIHALVHTRDGYMWLGTSAGLVRFDGARFVVTSAGNTKGFGDGGVSTLAEGREGALYVGTTTGAVLRYADGAFSRVSVPGSVAVRTLFTAADGSLWIAIPGVPVHRLKDGALTSLFKDIGGEVPAAMAEDPSGAIWMGAWREGLIRFGDGRFTRHPMLDDTVQAMHIDRAGVFWIGTPHGLYRIEGQRRQRFTRRDGLSHDNVFTLLEDRDGNLWVGTAGGGINRLSHGRFSHLTVREGLSDDDVRCLLEDPDGNLWVGTAGGLSSLSDGRFVTYGALEGLPDPAVPSVAAAADGSTWIGTTSAGLARLRDGVVTHVPLPRGIGKDAILVLYEARDGGLWISVENGRLFLLKDGRMTEHTPVGLPSTWRISSIAEDDEGPLFFLNGFGQLARIRDRHVVALDPRSPRLGYAHCIYRDAEGTLWLGTPRGVARVRGTDYRVFTTHDGLPHDRVRWVTGDPDGGLWLATIGGLAYMHGETIRKVTVEDGLPEGYLRVVLDDGLGYLWAASTGHVFRLDKREVRALFDGKIRRVSPLLFDTSDGLRSTETLLSNSPGFRGADGRLWFATARGVSVVDPARIRTDDPAPRVRLETLTVDGVRSRPRPGSSAEYAPGRGEVAIEYTASSFGAASRIRFRHRLAGFDDAWVDADRREAYYSNLPPGTYRFEVTASNRDGVWSGQPVGLAFSIRPPFYRTTRFFLACAAAVVAVAAAGYRFHLGQIRARYAAVAAERERIAREWHDSLAQGIAAVGIQLQAIKDKVLDPEEVRRHAEIAWRMVQSSLEQVRGSIWALRARNLEGAGLAVVVQETLGFFTTGTRVAGTVVVEGSPYPLHPDVEWNALRIVQEAITNAIRHAGARRLDVTVAYDAGLLRLSVRDDGRGFDGEHALGSSELHFGLLGMRERAMALGGTLSIESELGRGTNVLAGLPTGGRWSAPPYAREERSHA